MNPCFATIVSPNYLAYARVLAESLQVHSPGSHFEVLLVNRPEADVVSAVRDSGLNVTYATGLGLHDFDRLAYQFDLVELNTALKPTFLKSLLARGFDGVVYLDPDICLYAPPAPVTDALREADAVLIPHALAPAMDGLRPSDIDFLRTGSFNLGFAAIRASANGRALLDWWEARCLGLGFNDPGFGTFVDQKWMDLAPCYFEGVRVLKHRGCNVAYWNLHEREVSGEKGRYSVGAEPLVFFHFSGVDPKAPAELSRHQNRHRLVAGTPVAALVADYCERLARAGHEAFSKLPYSFARLDDGSPITPMMRRAACSETAALSEPFSASSPFQQRLRAAGLAAPAQSSGKPVTTLNFDAGDSRVTWVNRTVRLAARIIGAERVAALVRYATFLGWQHNLTAVLLDKPFELRHLDPRASREGDR